MLWQDIWRAARGLYRWYFDGASGGSGSAGGDVCVLISTISMTTLGA